MKHPSWCTNMALEIGPQRLTARKERVTIRCSTCGWWMVLETEAPWRRTLRNMFRTRE